jgi:3-deoxy-manno-octulosonate cytidylyltransferase (CMP-KDO synthetase)
MTAFRIVIPARYASTRFPGKPLALIAGRALLDWVHASALTAGATEVLIATDDARIAQLGERLGAQVAMTSADHPSGTARIAQVAADRGWSSDDIVVNLQGDEPLMPAVLLRQVAALLAAHPEAAIATLATPIRSRAQFLDPACVKVVTDASGRALYFSRAPIPWPRDADSDAPPPMVARRHLGLYAYRVRALVQLASTSAPALAVLEDIEKLEQLRALALGMIVQVADAESLPGPDVNLPQDVALVEAQLRSR